MNNDEYTPLTAHFEFLAKENEQLKTELDQLTKQINVMYNILHLKQGGTLQKKTFRIIKKIKNL
jgi:hypothetical protein